MSHASEHETLAKPETLLRVPVGLTSPLWGLFAGAAVTGATWWWMTRWVQPRNLEAMFGATAETKALAGADAEAVVISLPIAEMVETIVEVAPEPVVEAVAESTVEVPSEAPAEHALEAVVEAAPEPFPEPIVEALVEKPFAFEPMAVEAAPEPVPELTAEALVETPLSPEPVVVETAPIQEPVVIAAGAADEALEAVAGARSGPKAKKKIAAAKAD